MGAAVCGKCGRELRSLRSRLRGFGPTCWGLYLGQLDPEARKLENMIGYNWMPQSGGYYLVVTPEHKGYMVDPDEGLCECMASGQPAAESRRGHICKHVRWIRREVNWTPPMRQRMSAERVANIERDIAIDFA